MAYLIPADLSQPIREVTIEHPESIAGLTGKEMKQLIGAQWNIAIQQLPCAIPGCPGVTHFVVDDDGLFAKKPNNERMNEFLPIPSKREVKEDLRRRKADMYLGPPLDGDQDAPAFSVVGDVLLVTIENMGYEDERIY